MKFCTEFCFKTSLATMLGLMSLVLVPAAAATAADEVILALGPPVVQETIPSPGEAVKIMKRNIQAARTEQELADLAAKQAVIKVSFSTANAAAAKVTQQVKADILAFEEQRSETERQLRKARRQERAEQRQAEEEARQAEQEEAAKQALIAKREEESRLALIAKQEEQARQEQAREKARLARIAKEAEEKRQALAAKQKAEAQRALLAKQAKEAERARQAKQEEEARRALAARQAEEARRLQLAKRQERLRREEAAWQQQAVATRKALEEEARMAARQAQAAAARQKRAQAKPAQKYIPPQHAYSNNGATDGNKTVALLRPKGMQSQAVAKPAKAYSQKVNWLSMGGLSVEEKLENLKQLRLEGSINGEVYLQARQQVIYAQ